MRLRILMVGALAVGCASFAACTSNPSFTPTPTPPLPTPAPTAHLAGTQTQTFTYQYGFPTKIPTVTIKSSVKENISAFATSPPVGLPQAATTDVQVRETEATKLQTNSSVTDTYVASSGAKTVAYASETNINDTTGGQSSTEIEIYGTPRQLSGPTGTSWKNAPGEVIHETYGDGHYEDRTIASDASYKETGTTYNANATLAKIKLVEQATGAGFYQGPLVGTPESTAFQFAEPSGTPSVIAITLFLNSQTIPEATIPSWFGEPPKIFQDRNNSLKATTPAACDANAGISTTLEHHYRKTIDTIIGYIDHLDVKTYSTANGPVCILFDDFLDNYYDWQGDTPYFVLFSGNDKPISTINTVLTLLADGAHAASTHANVAGAATPTISAALATAAEAHFLAKIDALHAKLRDQMFHHIANHHGGAR